MVERMREFRFPPDSGFIKGLRSTALDAVLEMGLPEKVGQTTALVLDELVNNAIEHGKVYRRRRVDLVVRLQRNDRGVHVQFIDPEMPANLVDELARMFANWDNSQPPDLTSERGRGLFLVAINLDGMQVGAAQEGGFEIRGSIQGP